MTIQAMAEKLSNFVEHYSNAFMVGVYQEKKLIYVNKTAYHLFGISTETKELDRLFSKAPWGLMEKVVKELGSSDLVVENYVPVLTVKGEYQLCHLQFGFFDQDKKEIFIEITPIIDNRMEMALAQVDHSARAEGILHFDEKLSVHHCNKLFYDVFESDVNDRYEHYENHFSNGFLPEVRKKLLAEIQENLQKSPHYTTKLKVITAKGAEKWYSLELQRRKLDDVGDYVMATLVNIESQVEMEEGFRSINRHFDALQELSEDLLFRIDIENKILTRRGEKVNLFGLTESHVAFPDAVIQGGAIHPDDVKVYEHFAEEVFARRGGSIEVRMKERNKEEYGFRRLTWIPVEDEQGKITEVVGKLVDVQAVKELEEKANYDALTNVLNKRAMLEFTSQILQETQQNEKHALFFMDLDDFKYVNDNLGHIFGDFLLSQLGKRLTDSVRSHDLVGRVGGDEFVIFLRDVPNTEILMGKAKILLATIGEDFTQGDLHHNIHGSMGVAVFPDHGTSYEELYHHADLALYQSKHQGKNLVTLYNDQLMEKE